MVITEHKLEVVEQAIKYWEDYPDRWVKGTMGYIGSGVCLMGNIAWHTDMQNYQRALFRDAKQMIAQLTSPAQPSISYYNDHVCTSVKDALVPLYMLRDAYRAELAPVAVTPHEYNLV